MNKRFPLLLPSAVAFSILSFLPAANTAIIARYDFPTAAGTTLPSASTDSDPGSVAGTLSLGAGFAGGGISSSSGNPVNSLFVQGANNSTEANAFSANKYLSFTLTPSAAMNFTSLSFDYRRDTSTAGNTIDLYASTGSFTSGVHLAEVNLPNVSGSTFSNLTIDLSSISSLQNVSAPITFRLYLWGGTFSTAINRFDNITLNAVPVPEPSALGLVLMALCGLTLHRRRFNLRRREVIAI